MANFDVVIRNVRAVEPNSVTQADIGIADGKIVEIAPNLDTTDAKVLDGKNKLAFPGAVDAHQHWGIYAPLEEDTRTESRASAQGGVTTSLTYLRTGQYYLNRGGSYRDFMPAALGMSDGKAYVDYGFHIAPMQASHIDELEMLVDEFGVASFKIFMFYGGHGLHGASSSQAEFLMTPPDEKYDIAHFEFVMRGLQALRERRPDIADSLSLSLHCETAEIMTAYTKIVEREGKYSGLKAYHHSRPPHSEGLAITIASYLAHETNLPSINLLHLTSRKAIEAAMTMAKAFPEVDFRREVTIGHLLTDITTAGPGAKVNPPIRPREDVEALWEHVLAGNFSWVASDHACCKDEVKFGEDRDDIFVTKSGFGGTEYLLPGLVSEGKKRGLSMNDVARLVATNPAERYGLPNKGSLAVGFDADIALVDDTVTWTVSAEQSESAQEYTPFEGQELSAAVTDVFLRGNQILKDGQVAGEPIGEYLKRPQAK